MRTKGLIATIAVLALVAAATTVFASPRASRVSATAAQDQASLAIVNAKAYTRSVKLRRRAPLAEWSIRNTSQIDATNVNTCVEFPRGFEIKWKADGRPPGVKITKGKRKACIPIQGGTIYVDSSSDYIAEGFAPHKAGTYKVKFTATASNAATVTKTVHLRILKHCTRQRCPGFTGS
jgi:type II secretory pathway pseudopilin PulG